MRDHFSAVAAGYARYRPHYPGALADFLASLTPPDSVVWEAGCGSGQFTESLATAFDRVVATDASWAQIAASPRDPRVSRVVQRAEKCALADGVAGLSVAAQAAHWFDLDAYYAEVRRVGAPGSIVALVSYGDVIGPPDVDRVIRDFSTRVLGPHWPPERRHVEAGYRTLPFPFEERSPPRFRMGQSWTMDDLVGYVATWSATGALIRARGRRPFEDFAAAVEAAWTPVSGRRTFRWPLSVRVGVV